MNIQDLSDSELRTRIELLRSKERSVTLKFLIHLGEFDYRKLYLEMGYSSLFDYCTRSLGYSDSSAYRRIESARCLREHSELESHFLTGEVSISTIAAAAKAIKAKKAQAIAIVGKSAREVEALVAEVAPTAKPRECIKEIKVIKESENYDFFNQAVAVQSPAQEPTETRYEIKFSVSKEVYDEIQAIKAKLSNKLGSALSLETVFIELVNKFQSLPKERKAAPVNENSRYVPVSVKRAVAARDNKCCSYVSPDGVQCKETHFLHIDHIKPFALGGKTSSDNLRLLCSKHNQLLAKRTFGLGKFKQKVQITFDVGSARNFKVC